MLANKHSRLLADYIRPHLLRCKSLAAVSRCSFCWHLAHIQLYCSPTRFHQRAFKQRVARCHDRWPIRLDPTNHLQIVGRERIHSPKVTLAKPARLRCALSISSFRREQVEYVTAKYILPLPSSRVDSEVEGNWVDRLLVVCAGLTEDAFDSLMSLSNLTHPYVGESIIKSHVIRS